MPWSRLRGRPPGLRHLPADGRPPPEPLLTQPFAGAMTAWLVVFGAVVAELAGGAAVADQMSATIAVVVLIVPVVVAFGFAAVQWWQVRSSGAAPASRWHLIGVAAAALTWAVWPTVPGALAGTGVPGGMGNGHGFCYVLPNVAAVSRCLQRAAQAADDHDLAWWCTAGVIIIAALLARRSRIAAYAAIPAAFAGTQLATYFLNQFALYYHLGLSVPVHRAPACLVQWLPMLRELLLLSGRGGGR